LFSFSRHFFYRRYFCFSFFLHVMCRIIGLFLLLSHYIK
jgi:hypothetical protein